MKIAIAIPTNRGFKAKTVLALSHLIHASKEHELIFLMPTEGFNTAENRNLCVAQAIQQNCDYILFSDDDMVYYPSLLEDLLKEDKDIIGVLYHMRRLPLAYVIEYLPDGIATDEDAIKQVRPFKCKAVGTGFLLVKTEVFKKISQPHFGYKWNDNGSVKMSTDWFMLEKAREAGYEVWCSPLEISHVGDYLY